MSYIMPAIAETSPPAAAWEAYLAENCEWEADDFGSGYAWETDVPEPEDFASECEALNAHLASIERCRKAVQA